MSELLREQTIARAWLQAARHLMQIKGDHSDFNLVLDIAEPTHCEPQEVVATQQVDAFLVSRDAFGLHTIANTIFPQQLYRRYGAQGIFDVYPNKIFPRISQCKENSKWGTYMYRMVRRIDPNGNVIVPLRNIVSRLATESGNAGPKRARYELNLVEPFLDLSIADPSLKGDNLALGGPCLSHLSFKLRPGGIVSLTAFYRSHYYIERALGNLIGLTRLLEFVAREANLRTGPLTCISSYAKIDTGPRWNTQEVSALLSEYERELGGRPR